MCCVFVDVGDFDLVDEVEVNGYSSGCSLSVDSGDEVFDDDDEDLVFEVGVVCGVEEVWGGGGGFGVCGLGCVDVVEVEVIFGVVDEIVVIGFCGNLFGVLGLLGVLVVVGVVGIIL